MGLSLIGPTLMFIIGDSDVGQINEHSDYDSAHARC